MSDKQVLEEVKKLSNGKFGKNIVIGGDGQIVLQRLMEIYILVSNHLGGGYSEVQDHNPSDFNGIKLPKYNDKKSRLYFSPNTNPAKAHKNGFNLAIRETEKLLAQSQSTKQESR